MTLFLIGFVAGAVACPAIISYHNWRQRRRGGDQ